MIHQRSGIAGVKTIDKLSLNERFIHIDARIAWMEDHGVDRIASLRLAGVALPASVNGESHLHPTSRRRSRSLTSTT